MQRKRIGERHRGKHHIAIDHGTCIQCAGCVSICPTEALHMHALQLECQDVDCIGCDLCVRFCPVVALELQRLESPTPVTARS